MGQGLSLIADAPTPTPSPNCPRVKQLAKFSDWAGAGAGAGGAISREIMSLAEAY